MNGFACACLVVLTVFVAMATIGCMELPLDQGDPGDGGTIGDGNGSSLVSTISVISPGTQWVYSFDYFFDDKHDDDNDLALTGTMTRTFLPDTVWNSYASTNVKVIEVFLEFDQEQPDRVEYEYFLQGQDGTIYPYGNAFLDEGGQLRQKWVTSPPYYHPYFSSPITDVPWTLYEWSSNDYYDTVSTATTYWLSSTKDIAPWDATVWTGIGTMESYILLANTEEANVISPGYCSFGGQLYTDVRTWFVPEMGAVQISKSELLFCGPPMWSSGMDAVLESTNAQ